MDKVTVTDAVNEIEPLTDYRFLYNREDVDLNRAFSIAVKKKRLRAVLSEIPEGTGVEYDFLNKQIILRGQNPQPGSHLQTITTRASLQQTVTGIITDEDGQPLPGATIVEQGTSNGTQSDMDGNFTLNVADQNAILVISYIGFVPQEIAVDGKTSITVVLKQNVAGLEEIVVVGYGVTKKSDLTGAVSTIKAAELPVNTNTSVEQALISKAAGLTITTASGQPGAGVNVLIRGAANVSASNAPLYVIDGFPVTGGVEPGVDQRYGNSGSRSPLNDINPNDIASIEVLKDASATAIYGARASNGVILITTKRGKEGTVKVEYSSNYTSQTVSKWLDLLNATEFMTERNELLEANGEAPA